MYYVAHVSLDGKYQAFGQARKYDVANSKARKLHDMKKYWRFTSRSEEGLCNQINSFIQSITIS